MIKALQCVLLAGLLACTGLAANAQPADSAAEAVGAALQQGAGYDAIVLSLTAAPRELSLPEATVTAMNAGGESNRIDFVKAGVGAAGDLPQAQAVVDAVRIAAGDGSQEAAAAFEALREYVRLMQQPDIYQDEYSPTGGATVQGGGTSGPGKPVVSPAS